ncbi:Methyltransferase FkbM family [uncultured Mycobacterium sp.]|uniref:Rhodanese domain-containing protein n=3 Tax=Mycobacteriaceae TaxID=1762 RepID=A0A064CBN4_9MYCO|nr:hypothetical protein Y900_027780 [Mycolicibacterium aromaticivorans JS19b1 = JCM 16368]SBS79585.1 Methyltransferase FkbM family [uncultured Mycobacterium sp.]
MAADWIVMIFARVLRAMARLLQTPKESVPLAEKVFRGALLLPVYSVLSMLLRGRARLGRTVLVAGRTGFGATLMCRLPDLIATYIWVFEEWEPDLTRFVASRCDDGDVFIDVGANTGYYSLLAARSVGVHGSVVAVEASPTMFDELRRNVRADQLGDHIRLVNKAAAAKSGTLTVFSGPRHNAGMSTTLPTRGLDVESTIEALPLDQILTFDEVTSIRIVKIDVEGAEPDVLAGMANLIGLLRSDAEIVVELSPRWWPDPHLRPIDVLRPFVEAGFNVYKMENSYTAWRYLWPNDVSNAIRVRDDLTKRVSRLDLVLSRHDGDFLAIETKTVRGG